MVSGNLDAKVEPAPPFLLTLMLPPSNSTMLLTGSEPQPRTTTPEVVLAPARISL
jgi:hypothetical protein